MDVVVEVVVVVELVVLIEVVKVVEVVRPVDDRILHRADALDLAADAVAWFEEDRRVTEDADTGRSARRDDVAGLERDDLLMCSMSEATSKIMSAVVPFCIGISRPASGPRPSSATTEASASADRGSRRP